MAALARPVDRARSRLGSGPDQPLRLVRLDSVGSLRLVLSPGPGAVSATMASPGLALRP